MTESLGTMIYRLSVLIRLTRPPQPDRQNLSEREVLLMFLLQHFGRCSVSGIRERLDVPIQTVSSYLKNLEGRKYISREIDSHDKRIHFIDLTKTGRGVLKHLEHMRGAGYDEFIFHTFGISTDEAGRIHRVVNDAIEILQKTLGQEIEQLVRKRRPPDTVQDTDNTKE